jgi:hypothetical protein
MYSGIKFQAWDSDNDKDKTLDMRPGLENVYSISLAAPVTGSGAQIRDVLSLACGTGGTTTSAADELNVDCPQTKLQGLVVSANAEVTGDLILKGEYIEAKFAKSEVYTFVDKKALTVPKPVCPTGYSGQIAASVMSYDATDVRKQLITHPDHPTVPNSWAVSLNLTVGDPPFTVPTKTIPNPDNTELLVQTWCKETVITP